ncbi:MAG TPA: thioesterase family protein [Myxococcales bacterium]|nr:thioesterase family protein [Myxococcales bacterium]
MDPEKPITYRGTIYPWHCDHMGHMNVMWYAGKFDEASWSLLASVGLTAAYLRDHGRGMVAAEQHVTYRKELVAGDTVFVRSFVNEVRDKAMVFTHEMVNAHTLEVAATARFVGVHIDRATRRACPLPPQVRAALQPLHLVPQERVT